jgi:4-hydroxythreonine-4-phosphate dehydrogenase
MPAPPPVLAVTMGDPAGIGPEIIVKAARTLAPRLAAGEMRLLVIGHATALDAACAALGHAAFPRAGTEGDVPPLALLPAGAEQGAVETGRLSPEAGRFSFLAVDQAVRLALAGRIAAIVTAPLNKEALNLAGYKYAGHTDMLADLTGQKTSVMMLAHGNMRVSHVTTHVALEKVPALVTPERVRRTIDLTHDALCRMGIARPHIAVAALNPHAGEGGLFGTQDSDVTAPVVAQCNAEGLHVSGPVPGDTVFVKLRGGQYDAVVAMYHDQGHIPVKLLGFQMNPATGTFDSLSGVNITLGLPVIRTSVDHGTAFDIAGKGIANADSMVEAIEVALQMTAAKGAPA